MKNHHLILCNREILKLKFQLNKVVFSVFCLICCYNLYFANSPYIDDNPSITLYSLKTFAFICEHPPGILSDRAPCTVCEWSYPMYSMCVVVPHVQYVCGCAPCTVCVWLCPMYSMCVVVPHVQYVSGCVPCTVCVWCSA